MPSLKKLALAAALWAVAAAAFGGGPAPARAARWAAVFWDGMDANTGWRVSPSGDSQYGMCAGTPNGNTYPQAVYWSGSVMSVRQNAGIYNPGTGRVEWYVDAVVGRDDVFQGRVPSGYGWAFEVRMNFVAMWGYGTGLGAGTGSIWQMPDGHRWCIGEPGNPDQLGWANLFGVSCNEVTCPEVRVLGTTLYGPGGCSGCQSGWFTFRLEVDPSGAWRAYLDRGSGFFLVGRGTGMALPRILHFGNAFKLPWMGKWTDFDVDYVKLEVYPAGSLSLPANISRAEGWVGAGYWAGDPVGRLSGVGLYRSPTGYQSWALRASAALGGSSASGSLSFDPAQDPRGTYYFVVNVTTNDGGACTGNAQADGSTLFGGPLPLGWTACGGSAAQTVRLWDSVVFTGRVTRLGDGAPLAGVQVDECLDGWNCRRSAWTDSAGNFWLQDTRPWEWSGYSYVYLIVRPPGGYSAWSAGPGQSPGWAAPPNAVVYPANPNALEGNTYGQNNFVLAWPITFQGRVYNRTTGAGMGGVTVVFRLDSWNQVGSVATDGAGNFSWTWPNWPPAGYSYLEVAVSPPAGWTVAQAGPGTPPGWTAGTVIRYPTSAGAGTYPQNNFGLDGLYTFSGRVTRRADGAGVGGAQLRLIRESDGTVLAQTTTAADGSYSLGYQGYAAWNLLLRVVPPPFYNPYSASSASGGQPAAADTLRFGAGLGPGSYGGNNFVLQAYAAFSGRVTRRADGAALGGLTVQALVGPSLWAQTTTAADGSFAFTYDNWPPAGDITIRVVPPAGCYIYQAQAQAPAYPSGTDIILPRTAAPGSYPGQNFVVGCRLVLSGRVYRYWDGRGVAGATLQLLRNGTGLLGQTTTAADGSFAFTYDNWPLGPGEYADLVVVPPAGYLPYQAQAPAPAQVVNPYTIRYPAATPAGSYGGNEFKLTVPPPPPPGGSVGGGSGAGCQGPCVVLMGGRLSPPAAGAWAAVNLPAGRDDIDLVELRLRRTAPADGYIQGDYTLAVAQGATQVVFDRTSTADPTFAEKALGTYAAEARLHSAAAGWGDWGAVGSLTVFWLPGHVSGQ